MNTTINQQAFVDAEQYSTFILHTLETGLLPETFYRNVSDFGNGTTLNIKTIGEVVIQEVEEDVPLTYSAIDTGTVTLQITDFVGSAWYISDVLRQDGSQIEALQAGQAVQATRAIQEFFETRLYATLNDAQTVNDPNVINGFAHRLVATGTNETAEIADFSSLRLAFDKANVPMGGRVAIVDPVVAGTLNTKFQGTYSVDSNPSFQNVLENGFDRDHRFVMNLFGWDIWTSNLLPDVAAGQGDGTDTLTNDGKANIFMSVLDDNTKPGMVAWRQMPVVEGERNKDNKRDEFVQTARFGVGVQRVDTLAIYLTDATLTA